MKRRHNISNNIQTRIIKSSFWSVLKFITGFFRQLLLVPLFLTAWGKSDYAKWLLILSISILITSINTGIYQYIGNKFNVTFHTNKEKAISIFRHGFYLGVFLVIIESGIVGVISLDANSMSQILTTDISKIVESNLNIVFFILVSTSAFHFFIFRYVLQLYNPIGEIFKVFKIEVFYELLEVLVIATLLITGMKIYFMTLIYSAYKILFSIFIFALLYNRFKVFKWKNKFNLKNYFILIKRSPAFVFNNLFEKLYTDGISILISNIFSVLLIPVFTTIRTMGNLLITSSNFFSNSVMPDLQRYFAKNEKKKIIFLFDATWIFITLPVNLAILIGLPWIKDVYLFWTKGELHFDGILLAFILSSAIILNFNSIVVNFLKAINNTKFLYKFTFIKVILIFSISYLFKNTGLSIIGIALFISEIVTSLFFANMELNKIIKELNFVKITYAFLPNFVTILTVIGFYTLGFYPFYLLIPISIVLILYFIKWKELDAWIKEKIIHFLNFNFVK